MRISDWSSDVCSSDLLIGALVLQLVELPDSLSAARPLWMPLMLAYWALREPQLPALVPAFLLGLMLDVLYAAPLGQHALGLVVVVYLVVRLRSFFIIFPLWQATVALVPAWVLYCFLMYWIDGATQQIGRASCRERVCQYG